MTDDATPVPHEPLPSGRPRAVDVARLRIGDAERYEAATALGEHFATGRLDRDEFDTRVQSAYGARTRADLETLFGDLPDPAPFRPAAAEGWVAGRTARQRATAPPRRLPVPPLLLLLPVLIGLSAVLRFPVFPLFFLFLWLGGGRRAWR
jgi:Domain of unknown function (DUF1707)